jgi:hypothetical protein
MHDIALLLAVAVRQLQLVTLLLPLPAHCLHWSLQFCKAVRWELYCESKSSLSKIARGLITGFLPSLLITLWQVRCSPHNMRLHAAAYLLASLAGAVHYCFCCLPALLHACSA